MQAIADLAQRIIPGVNWPAPTEPKRNSIPQRVKLAQVQANHPEVATAVKACREWADRRRAGRYPAPSLIFSGPYGTGKTMLARVILWSIIDTPPDKSGLEGEITEVPAGRFFLASDLLLSMGAVVDHETQTQSASRPSRLLETAPLVVIDDVGGEGVIPFVRGDDQEHERQARYFRFIDHCYTAGISVVITTNLRADGRECQLGNHLGGRAWDRLLEMCPVGSIVNLWNVPSWRVKAGGR